MNHKSIIINGVSNHIHLLVGFNPKFSISDTVYNVKRNSTLFINKEKMCMKRFAWQKGYGAFSYTRKELSRVYYYILNQEKHHKKKSFKDEFTQFLLENGIAYNEDFLFDFDIG
jgi:REP element-mobilizing transposase RayT